MSDYFTFSFVRNPFDRILSSYLNYTIRNTPNFDDYIKMVEDVVLKQEYIHCAEIKSNDLSHYIPQTTMIGEKGIDFIGRLENSEEDIKKLYDLIKIDIIKTIRFIKKGIDYKHYYSLKNRRIIEAIYKEDLERFEYSY